MSRFSCAEPKAIRNIMRKRDLAKRAAVKSPEKWIEYKKLRNTVTQKIELAIQSDYHGLIEEHQNNPKKYGRPLIKS